MGDFVIKDGVLLSYTGTDRIVYVPDSTTEIAAGCFAERIRVDEIYLPPTIKKIGEDALGIATVHTEIIPCVKHYVFHEKYGRFGRWRWYNKTYFDEYRNLHQKESACEERLKQIEELKKKREKPIDTLVVILSLVANILLWCYWPWLTNTMAWLCGPLPKVISTVVYAIMFGVLWVGIFLAVGVIVYMFAGSSPYFEEETALKKQLEELNARDSEMKEYIQSMEWKLDKWIYGDRPVSAAKSSEDPAEDPMTWSNGLPWTAH